MKTGGKRAGAGRKPGTANVKTREIANRLMEDGITPLEVMLQAMRSTYDTAMKEEDPKEKAMLLRRAAESAERAAPYIHPRLQPVDSEGSAKQNITINIVQHGNKSPEQLGTAPVSE